MDTTELYLGLEASFTKMQLREWSNDPELYDDLEEFDHHIHTLMDLDFQDNIYYAYHDIDIDLMNFMQRYADRFNSEFAGILWQGERSSHYGAIGGNGSDLGAYTDTLEDLVDMSQAQEFRIYITDNNTLAIDFIDHDGTNTLEACYISTKMEERSDAVDEDPRDFYRGKKPVKLDRKFLSEYGL